MAEQINQLILSPILFGREFGVSLSATYANFNGMSIYDGVDKSNGIYVISCREFNRFLKDLIRDKTNFKHCFDGALKRKVARYLQENAVWLMVGGEMPFDKSGQQKNLAQGHSFVPVIYPLNQKNIDAINGLHPDYYDLNEAEAKKYLDEKYAFVSLYLDALIKE